MRFPLLILLLFILLLVFLRYRLPEPKLISSPKQECRLFIDESGTMYKACKNPYELYASADNGTKWVKVW